jgi:hypothetical protein
MREVRAGLGGCHALPVRIHHTGRWAGVLRWVL